MRRIVTLGFCVFFMLLNPIAVAAESRNNPSHLFFLFSYGRSFAPDRTHTFGFFAKMNPQDPTVIDEHVPISWLPVVTKPRQNPDGKPQLDNNDTLQIAPVAAGRVSWSRLGWNFSMRKTILYRRKMAGIKDIKSHGAFVVTSAQYAAAKSFRDEMLKNVDDVMNGHPRNPERYYYKAINQTLFVCPNGRVSGELNCFQAVLASFGACETSGPLSGVTVTDYLLERLKERKLVGETFIDDPEKIEPFVRQIMESEVGGEMDRPE